MRVWITTWAFRRGILETEAEWFEGVPSDVITVVGYGLFHSKGKEWHDTLESAQKQVVSMFAKRRASLDKQLREIIKSQARALVVTQTGVMGRRLERRG